MSERALVGELTSPPRRFRRYSEYKSSGVEWLGDIPSHWRVVSLKRLGELKAGAGFPEDEQGLATEDVPFFKVGDMSASGNEYDMRECQHTISLETARRLRAFVFPPNAIIFAKVGAALLLNRRRFLVSPSCIDNNLMGFTAAECSFEWAMYWLRGLDMGELANPGAVPSVNESQMRATPAVVPTLSEQRAIAAFLDRETARIDALVAKKERLVELLQEKRAALVTRAVTRGLDPNVPMKDSGVQWLGEIPDHWENRRLRSTIVDIQAGVWGDEADGQHDVPCIRVADFDRRSFRVFLSDPTLRSIAPKVVAFRRLHVGDLLLEKSGGGERQPVGAVVLYDHLEPAVCSNFIARMTVAEGHQPRFLTYLHAGLYALRINTRHIKQSTGIQNLDNSSYLTEMIGLPPESEQKMIASFLDSETEGIDALITKIRTAIDHLHELRTALISAAVTGKIDVREEAP